MRLSGRLKYELMALDDRPCRLEIDLDTIPSCDCRDGRRIECLTERAHFTKRRLKAPGGNEPAGGSVARWGWDQQTSFRGQLPDTAPVRA